MLWITVPLAAAAIYAYLILPGSCPPSAFEPFMGRNFAHRGLHSADKSVLENSMAAFRAAVDAGYGIELDIQLSNDGQVVVFHDDTLDRVCGVTGRVDGYTYEQLREFRLEGSGEGIPLFTDVLGMVAGRAPIIVELKRSHDNKQLCEAAYGILRGYNGPYCVESFYPFIVNWFRKNAPHIVRGQLSAPPGELGAGLAGVLLGHGLTQFLGRPQFIAYKAVARPLAVRLAQRFCHRVAWTVRPGDDRQGLQQRNDALIFEYYLPEPRFKGIE